ncbi:MAG: hypothetical protein U0559_11150 [Anaerolineae bacterium]
MEQARAVGSYRFNIDVQQGLAQDDSVFLSAVVVSLTAVASRPIDRLGWMVPRSRLVSSARDGYGNESQMVDVLDVKHLYLPLIRR